MPQIALRIPNHKKTGSYQIDSDNAHRREALRTLVTELLEDDSHAPSVLMELHRRKASPPDAGETSDMVFKKWTTLGVLDDEWCVEYLVGIPCSRLVAWCL